MMFVTAVEKKEALFLSGMHSPCPRLLHKLLPSVKLSHIPDYHNYMPHVEEWYPGQEEHANMVNTHACMTTIDGLWYK